MILESKQPCDGCAYIQATGYNADSATVCLETQHIHATPGRTQYQNCGKQIAYDTLLDEPICGAASSGYDRPGDHVYLFRKSTKRHYLPCPCKKQA